MLKRQLTEASEDARVTTVSDWQERLGEAIKARGISGGELGRRTGFSAQYINSLRSKDRGARLPHDTARRIAQSLGVTVEWLIDGSGPRERLSDVYPIYSEPTPDAAVWSDRYPSRAEAIALLSTSVAPEVIAALRAFVPPASVDGDPGRDFWIDRARSLVKDLALIKSDPAFAPPPSSAVSPISPRGLPPGTPRRKLK